jgi:penicillin-binding protein 1A
MQSRYDRALQAGRQVGSTIKPFVYAAAFAKGLLPGSLVEDAPIRPGELAGYEGSWSPDNSDGKFLGFVPAAVGLIRSRNAMTVRVGNYAGMDAVLGLLRDAGIGVPDDVSPQVYIGNTGSTLKSLTAAMSIFPNNGVRRRPFLIRRVEDASHEMIYETPVLENDVLPAGIAQMTGRLLERVMTEGTGAAARSEFGFKEKSGGKTGTTNDYHDAWFAGYTSEITCGVWAGFDQPQTIVQGAYGAKLSLPVWVDVMNAAIAHGYRPAVPRATSVVARASLCRVSGQLATDECSARGDAYEDELPADLVPTSYCPVHGGGAASPGGGQKKEGFFGRILKWFK